MEAKQLHTVNQPHVPVECCVWFCVNSSLFILICALKCATEVCDNNESGQSDHSRALVKLLHRRSWLDRVMRMTSCQVGFGFCWAGDYCGICCNRCVGYDICGVSRTHDTFSISNCNRSVSMLIRMHNGLNANVNHCNEVNVFTDAPCLVYNTILITDVCTKSCF